MYNLQEEHYPYQEVCLTRIYIVKFGGRIWGAIQCFIFIGWYLWLSALGTNGKLGETIRGCQISHSQSKHDCKNAKPTQGGSKQINLHHPFSGSICMF